MIVRGYHKPASFATTHCSRPTAVRLRAYGESRYLTMPTRPSCQEKDKTEQEIGLMIADIIYRHLPARQEEVKYEMSGGSKITDRTSIDVLMY